MPPLRTVSARVLTAAATVLAIGLVGTGLTTLYMYRACETQGRSLVVERIAWFGLSKSFSCRDLD